MIKKTITLPNKKLRKISEEVKIPLSHVDEKIAHNLIYYLDLVAQDDNDFRAGIGIAAVQLGFLKKMFLVSLEHHDHKEHELLINPKIESYSVAEAALATGEGCLSIQGSDLGQEGFVHRKNKIIISGYSYFQKKQVTLIHVGFLAIVYQHEMDHLEGKLFIDRIDKNHLWLKKDNEVII